MYQQYFVAHINYNTSITLRLIHALYVIQCLLPLIKKSFLVGDV